MLNLILWLFVCGMSLGSAGAVFFTVGSLMSIPYAIAKRHGHIGKRVDIVADLAVILQGIGAVAFVLGLALVLFSGVGKWVWLW